MTSPKPPDACPPSPPSRSIRVAWDAAAPNSSSTDFPIPRRTLLIRSRRFGWSSAKAAARRPPPEPTNGAPYGHRLHAIAQFVVRDVLGRHPLHLLPARARRDDDDLLHVGVPDLPERHPHPPPEGRVRTELRPGAADP